MRVVQGEVQESVHVAVVLGAVPSGWRAVFAVVAVAFEPVGGVFVFAVQGVGPDVE